jgi:hypothetical protein
MSGPAGNGLGNTINDLRSARRRRDQSGRNGQVPATYNERHSGLLTGHSDQLPVTRNERRRGQRPGKGNQVPATYNERRRGLRTENHDSVPARRRGNGLGTTAKYLRGAAGIGLGIKIN